MIEKDCPERYILVVIKKKKKKKKKTVNPQLESLVFPKCNLFREF